MRGIILGMKGSPNGMSTFWTGAFVDEEIVITDREVCVVDGDGIVKDSVPRSELVHLLVVEGNRYRLEVLR